jgi:predicted homoserine dehydrogenase-like protein
VQSPTSDLADPTLSSVTPSAPVMYPTKQNDKKRINHCISSYMSSTSSGASPSHSLHRPYHARRTQRPGPGGSSSVGSAEGAVVVLGMLGGEVIVVRS